MDAVRIPREESRRRDNPSVMNGQELERLFERFRRHGEAEALGEVFDATAGDLRRIARRLTRNRSEADDLVQATFLSAIENAATFDSTRALKPWLIGILVRQAASERRRRSRSKSIETDSSSGDAEPGDALADREFAQALALALERLTPAEREVLLPLLLDGKRAVEIARELEKRPDTVHMRIHRGLARLRKLLPAGFSLGIVATFVQRRALAQVRGEVLRMARSSTGVTSTAIVGIPIAVKLVLVGISVAGLTVAASFVRGRETVRPAAPLDAVSRVATEIPSDGSSEAREQAGIRPGSRSAFPPGNSTADASTAPTRWVVHGQLHGLQYGETSTATLTVEPLGPGMAVGGFDATEVLTVGARPRNGSTPPPSVTATVPPDGAFEVDVSTLFTADPANAPKELGLTIDHARYLVAKARVLVETGEIVVGQDGQPVLELQQDVDVHLAAIVRGQVFAPAGSSANQCDVSIHRMDGDAPKTDAEDATTCAPGAEFRLRVGFGASYLVLASTDDSTPATVAVVTAVGEERALPAIQLDTGLSISGTVTSAGSVRPEMPVVASSTNPPSIDDTVRSSFRWSPQGFVRIHGQGRTDALGRFTISGLPAAEFRLMALGCPAPVDLNPIPNAQTPRVTVTAPADDVAVASACSVIEFHFADVDPTPTEIAITVGSGDGSLTTSAPWSAIKRIGFAPNQESLVSFRMEGDEPISASYALPGPGEERVESVQPVPISAATLRVHLTTQAGDPIPQAAFGFFVDPPSPGQVRISPDFSQESQGSNGDFVLAGIRSGSYEVRVHTGGTFARYTGYECEASLHVVLPAGADEARSLVLSTGGRIRVNVTTSAEQQFFGVRLLDTAGVPCKTNFGHADVDLYGASSWSSSGGSLFRGVNDTFPNLAAGDYRLEVHREPKAPLLVPVTVVSGRTSEITVDVDAP